MRSTVAMIHIKYVHTRPDQELGGAVSDWAPSLNPHVPFSVIARKAITI
jgi:hypothetical protein